MTCPSEEFSYHQYSPLRLKDIAYYLAALMLAVLLYSYLKAHGAQLQAQECSVTHQKLQVAVSYPGKLTIDTETNGVRL